MEARIEKRKKKKKRRPPEEKKDCESQILSLDVNLQLAVHVMKRFPAGREEQILIKCCFLCPDTDFTVGGSFQRYNAMRVCT